MPLVFRDNYNYSRGECGAYGATVRCKDISEIEFILGTSLFNFQAGRGWHFLVAGSILGVLLMCGPIETRVRSESTVLVIRVSTPEDSIAFAPGKREEILAAATAFFAKGSRCVSVTAVVGPPIKVFSAVVQSNLPDNRVVQIDYSEAPYLLDLYFNQVTLGGSNKFGPENPISFDMCGEPRANSTVMVGSAIMVQPQSNVSVTLTRDESMSVASMSALAAAEEGEKEDDSSISGSMFLSDEQLNSIPPMSLIGGPIEAGNDRNLTDPDFPTTSPIPAMPSRGLDGLTMASDISIGAQGRALGRIEEDAEFFAGAQRAWENSKNTPEGKRQKT